MRDKNPGLVARHCAPQKAEEIEDAMRVADVDPVRGRVDLAGWVHRPKKSSGSIGFEQIIGLCRDMEALLHSCAGRTPSNAKLKALSAKQEELQSFICSIFSSSRRSLRVSTDVTGKEGDRPRIVFGRPCDRSSEERVLHVKIGDEYTIGRKGACLDILEDDDLVGLRKF